MANPWFRLYAEMLNDPKVQIVTEALRWRYVAVLCLHCNDQYENAPDDEIALALRITVDEWLETREAFINRRLLNPDGSISGWEKRQYISDVKDPTAADRMKRYRKSKRNNRNATVTLRSPESDTDTEQKNKKHTPSGVEFTGVSDQVVADFKALRSRLRAPITQTAISGIQREADKAGITLEQALILCCERSWRGFKADWMTDANARASPRKTIHEMRAETIAGLTGRRDVHADRDRERYITSTAVRVA